MVCIGTVKGMYYWVKEINANFGQGTDGPMIGRAAAVRLERALKPHLAILQAHRDDCLQNPSTFFTYALMSLRPALKDHMRWVDQKFKEWDEQVLDEMESSKQDFKRRVHRRARPHGQVAYYFSTSADPLRFIAMGNTLAR